MDVVILVIKCLIELLSFHYLCDIIIKLSFKEGVRKEARITHFQANDEESIKTVKRDYNSDAKKPKTNAFIERQIRESLGDL